MGTASARGPAARPVVHQKTINCVYFNDRDTLKEITLLVFKDCYLNRDPKKLSITAIGAFSLCVYTVRCFVIRKVLKIRIWGVPRPSWAVGSYSSGPPAGGTPQILIFKT